MKGLRSSHRWGSTKVGGEEESKNFCGSTKDVEQRSSGALFVGEPMFVGGPSLVRNHGGARPRCMGIDTRLAAWHQPSKAIIIMARQITVWMRLVKQEEQVEREEHGQVKVEVVVPDVSKERTEYEALLHCCPWGRQLVWKCHPHQTV
jgi:hypothetical protein